MKRHLVYAAGWLVRGAAVLGMVALCTFRIDPGNVGAGNLLLLWGLAGLAAGGQWVMNRCRPTV